MVKMNPKFYYDDKNDILVIGKELSANEKFKGNIDVGDLILDISTTGRIFGIEILNASSILGTLGVKAELLKNISDADFKAQSKPSAIAITLLLKARNTREATAAMIAVPVHKPVYASA